MSNPWSRAQSSPANVFLALDSLSLQRLDAILSMFFARYEERTLNVNLEKSNRRAIQIIASEVIYAMEGDTAAVAIRLYGIPVSAWKGLANWFVEIEWEPKMEQASRISRKKGFVHFWMASQLYNLCGMKRSLAVVDLWSHLARSSLSEVPRLTLLKVYVTLQGDRMLPSDEYVVEFLISRKIPMNLGKIRMNLA